MQKTFFRLLKTIFSYLNMFSIRLKCYPLGFSFFQLLYPFISADNKKECFKRACNSKFLFFCSVIDSKQGILENVRCVRFASVISKNHQLDLVKKLCIQFFQYYLIIVK